MKRKKRRIVNAMPAAGIRPGIKPYNIARDNEGNAEITMYGEVVETVPTDWWTGEPIDGLYIVLADFLRDIEDIRACSSVTVRINSIGGDLYAGVSIYNRLKEMQDVTTIVDGMAASAASLIAQAATEGQRKVYESSQIMIHGASVLLFDWFNIQQIEGVRDQLASANDSVISIYAERTGETKTKLKHMVEQTTWMTGRDAVEKGFADEVINGNVSMSMTADRKVFVCNGIPMNTKKLFTIPENVQTVQRIGSDFGKKPVEDKENKKDKGGHNKMTVEELREQHPDLVKDIENAAMQNADVQGAVAAERNRIREIESIEASIADKDMVNNAKFGEKPMDAKELAFVAMQKQAQLGNVFLADMQKDAEASGAKDVQAAPAAVTPEQEQQAKDAADIKAAVEIANMIAGGK